MTAAPAAAATTATRSVLVIEDEVLIAMVLEDMLDILGHVVVGTPSTLDEAEAALAAGGFDLVVADVNLGAEPIYPLAERILDAGIPLILATGSHRDTLPPRFAGVPVLEKPYALAAIEAAMAQID
ncbi:MAG: response regulator [Sphingomonadaceae bacterium]|nr:response regulator [Sphingomonadaceae bacterium]